ncbi:unnamed protein product [Rotaria sp. Silwood2]|nr:unnamed protein product [Rotaria sp. Silwood2]
MVRKKSAASKAKSRRESYKRRQEVHSKISRSWRILIVTVKAFKKFLSLRRSIRNISFAHSFAQKSLSASENDLIDLNYINYRNSKDVRDTLRKKIQIHKEIDDQHVIKDIVKKVVSRVCRLDSERKRQLKNRQCRKQIDFRNKLKTQSKITMLNKYHNDSDFRNKLITQSKITILNKYHNNSSFRNEYKARMKTEVLKRYYTNNSIRLKMIQDALNWYSINNTLTRKKSRQLYNQRRRILKKYSIIESHKCTLKHNHLYIGKLKEFRNIIEEGPDYICISCGITFFRNQVIPFMKDKYVKQNMSFEMSEYIPSYFIDASSSEHRWICRLCSYKIKKQQLPSRALLNKLEVCQIPPELTNLNNLEKHLISLRLPFMKIVNLTSGKVSSRLAQKGTKGPLHCVPSDVQDTVTTLPRPVDKSMMVRLQLKRRIKYKAVWEEQLINPNDVRDALLILRKMHPGYKNIKINEIDESYLTSDQNNNCENNTNSVVEIMDIDIIETENSIEEKVTSDENHLKSLALGDIDNNNNNSDEEIDEDNNDIRTKYNIGTDSCTQPSDYNDFLVFDKEPCIIAPAEKNKLSSLLTDKTIEALAFPHLFPDGKGSFDEDRESNLKWKEYCKARLFSSDSRFAADSSYIFYLQYLGDLKQVYSGINIAFRKKLPMNAQQSLDETQMKFLMNKDMIYRHLQCVRGSPQYWHKRLKDLFAMTRQLGFPTFFLTLSCADLRWKEFVDTFVRHTGGTIKESYTFEEKTKLLRANPVLAARLFEKRFTNFMTLFIKGGASCLGNVKDSFSRIEMQLRGSPHSHMPLWVEGAPKYIGPETDAKTREEIVKFCDKYITTRFPSLDEDAVLHYLIKEVQSHSRNHSKSCLKYFKTLCRFGFPRPVARRTFICEPMKIVTDDDKQYAKRAKEILTEMNAAMNALEKEKNIVMV